MNMNFCVIDSPRYISKSQKHDLLKEVQKLRRKIFIKILFVGWVRVPEFLLLDKSKIRLHPIGKWQPINVSTHNGVKGMLFLAKTKVFASICIFAEEKFKWIIIKLLFACRSFIFKQCAQVCNSLLASKSLVWFPLLNKIIMHKLFHHKNKRIWLLKKNM